MSLINNEYKIDDIIEESGLDDVLKYILETYSSYINYETVSSSLDTKELLESIKNIKNEDKYFNDEVLSVFTNKELAEHATINILDEFNSKDILNYYDLSFEYETTLKQFDIRVIKSYLADYAYYNYTHKKCKDSNYHCYYDADDNVIDEFYELKSLLIDFIGTGKLPKIINLDEIIDIYFTNSVIEDRGHEYNIENHFIFINDLISKINIVLTKQNTINNIFCSNHNYYTSYYYIEFLQNLNLLKNNMIESMHYNDLLIKKYIELYSKVYTNILLDQIESIEPDSNTYNTIGLFDKNIEEISDERVLDFEFEKGFKDNLLKDIEEFFNESINTFDGGLMSELNDLKDI
jgi:hypothetical protein